MYGGARSEELRTAWEAAVRRLEADDARVAHFVFTHWTEQHPRVADDQAMADELVAWLRQQPFLRERLAVGQPARPRHARSAGMPGSPRLAVAEAARVAGRAGARMSRQSDPRPSITRVPALVHRVVSSDK